MQPKQEKIRHARIERRTNSMEVSEDNSMLWAVSYADFLMVLLSFFILFFSFDREKEDDLLNRIINTTHTNALSGREPNSIPASGSGAGLGAGKGPGNGTGTTDGTLTKAQSEKLVRHMGSLFKNFRLEQREEPAQLVIYMPDDSFRKGETEISNAHRDEFRATIENLKRFEKDISMTFVGHSDQSPVMQYEGRHFVDNFDLSALRATWALREAARLGLDPSRLQAKGVAEHSRASRTVSIVIEAKRAE